MNSNITHKKRSNDNAEISCSEDPENMSFFSQGLRRRKLNLCSCSSLILIIILITIIYFSEILLFGWRRGDVFCGPNLASETKLTELKNKVNFLTSILKRFGISEKEYIDEHLPKIFVVTPTHARPVQKAELTRLKNVFLHIPALHWIIVEDANGKSELVTNFLKTSSIPHTHLFKQTPVQWKINQKDPRWIKPRGVLQRNEGISWLRENISPTEKGVVYFADDDNTYSIELFKEMRYTQKISVWPVGFVGGIMVEKPLLDEKGRVRGFNANWRPDRKFPLDMASFAVNLGLLVRSTDAFFSHRSQRGFLETDFLEKLATRDDLEPKADSCTKVFVWHTQTSDPDLNREQKLKVQGKRSNLGMEV
ncbi:Galactosylgalactosylxylosylprotein 3-beta-glucuronosyltransferase I [Armadillidium nasatum]|uniref:Galactosylgalactosylxylosylprotein 3-beta-glucuronosyltransferase n=1 Tax=Armadillidium nasatum TaxID=96803 RepID=A0A5N5TM91_9CRUS|nr:Galactosylgalactosylxylosylprotein 3-beta-glucuronosyltransferase I [Armadillidium nasatum]